MGFNLFIRRLSSRTNSEAEGDEDNILKYEKEMRWPVSMWWERILGGEFTSDMILVSNTGE